MKAFPAETTEAFCDGHNAAFRYFGGVPRRIVYDNTKLAVARILGDGTRQRTQVFSELQSHYLFDDRFGRPGKGRSTAGIWVHLVLFSGSPHEPRVTPPDVFVQADAEPVGHRANKMA